jgi:hypothetical protein
MKISKILSRKLNQGFFWDNDFLHTNVGVCVPFISKLLNADADELTKINLILSRSNPKKKGFVKVNRYASNIVTVKKGEYFKVCYEEQELLNKAGINQGDNFWMKAEIIS